MAEAEPSGNSLPLKLTTPGCRGISDSLGKSFFDEDFETTEVGTSVAGRRSHLNEESGIILSPIIAIFTFSQL